MYVYHSYIHICSDGSRKERAKGVSVNPLVNEYDYNESFKTVKHTNPFRLVYHRREGVIFRNTPSAADPLKVIRHVRSSRRGQTTRQVFVHL